MGPIQKASAFSLIGAHSPFQPVVSPSGSPLVLLNHKELRRKGLEKWLKNFRTVLHQVAGTPQRVWVLFSSFFIIETIIVGVFRPKTIKVIGATHEQFEFGISVFLLSPVVCLIMAFLRSFQTEEMSMTSKHGKYGFVGFTAGTTGMVMQRQLSNG
ncbi:hypothetical protein MKW98_031023 [Papaver atlanticum]|uniref:Uncharacterized protein n=1 Tax=Papaver atlanticum TaxID=357466 RepID=A0AAD4S7M6_9MAGN|nr:hypothetical protein MKW98_031023 [Papaver atlanticum]